MARRPRALGRFGGIAKNVRHTLTFKILTDEEKIINWLAAQSGNGNGVSVSGVSVNK